MEQVDFSGMRARAEDLAARFEQMRSNAATVRGRIMVIRPTATSEDGYVKAVVDRRGRLQSLEIDPRVYRRPDSRRLAETIVETVRKAEQDADRQVEEAFEGFAPAADVRASLGLDLESVFQRLDEEADLLTKGDG